MSELILPLYVYPAPGAWDPLYWALSSNPRLKFTIVVNPGNGPGPNPLPDANYMREISKLNSFANVGIIGYVATTYAMKDLALVQQEIATYARWSAVDPSLSVRGIFLDETPNQYTRKGAEYLATLHSTIKSANGLAEGFVVHNPGSIPDPRYMQSADLTVVFEEAYQTYLNRNSAEVLAALNDQKHNLCVVMHSVPPDMARSEFKDLVRQLRGLARTLFLTDLSMDYYASFSPQFAALLEALH